MRVCLTSAAGLVALAICFAQPAAAQMNEASYVVTYIEVTPMATTKAVDLLNAQAQASRDESGNALYQVLQRIGRPNHFAIVETWKNAAAQESNAAANHTREFRAGLEPLLYSPYDERLHTDLHVSAGNSGAGAIFGLTHVDIIPTGLDTGRERIGEVVEASRDDEGVIRFDVLTQASRQNHMTLVESWESAGAQEAHSSTEHAKAFRAALQPLSGSLYDERLYRAL
ncbi:MAG: putative quinol monooxygenase [Candidatus Rariloculaceae bacterium]